MIYFIYLLCLTVPNKLILNTTVWKILKKILMLVKRTNLKVFTSKFVGTGPSSYEKRIYRAAVSQMLRDTALEELPTNTDRIVYYVASSRPIHVTAAHTNTVCNSLTLSLLLSYIYGAPSIARNANVVYIWTYVWQR